MVYTRNNLDRAASPYLQQHRDNPVHWQEWKPEVLKHARRLDRPLLVSVGYSTCHWCHVMAREAFSDQDVAEYLNRHFISIKVDREERPDIDQYLMKFLVARTGQGGWPLNVFLTPDLKPVTALTYAATRSRYGLPAFLDILQKVKRYYGQNKNAIRSFDPSSREPVSVAEERILEILVQNFDGEHGGFGFRQKFPPHCTLLFMLHYYVENPDSRLETMITRTLDAMRLGGLHDHLQGGFFRYCVDREWRIPHFEKMLYDQALLLWIYSRAFAVFQNPGYRAAAEGILGCLEDTFSSAGLYVSGHDADTDHREGQTYLWDYRELKQNLTGGELKILQDCYLISAGGNFEGKNHLRKRRMETPPELKKVEGKLLRIRKAKKQSFRDDKIVTSWNCLAGIALIHAGRYLHNRDPLLRAQSLYSRLKNVNRSGNELIHSSLKKRKNDAAFLEDHAALLLLITFLQEETRSHGEDLAEWSEKIREFQIDGKWLESRNPDFIPVEADAFDHPTPSSVSLAELALTRAAALSGKEYLDDTEFKTPLHHDFLNIAVMIRKGLFHLITSPDKIDWKDLPFNSLQKPGSPFSDCHKGTCRLDPPPTPKA